MTEPKNLLQKCNKAYNTQINDILLTALGYTLSDITSYKTNYITLEGHGREDIDPHLDVTRTLGWFTSMYPVRLEVKTKIGDSIKNMKESLRQTPNRGVHYAMLIGYTERTLPKITFNYLGQFNDSDDQTDSECWRIVKENSGTTEHRSNRDNNIINLNALVVGEEFTVHIESRLSKELTHRIARLFERRIIEIISHCEKKNTAEYTMSDFRDFVPYMVLDKKVKHIYKSIFIFPPGGSGAESYLDNIAPRLERYKLILFNNYYHFLQSKGKDKLFNNLSYEQLACNYISYIKSIQLKGPYTFLGWSFGGILAFEISRQLLDEGDNVEKLVLIDPYFNEKKALLDTGCKNININNINYKYYPEVIPNFNHTEIVLFKAQNAVKSSFDEIDTEEENFNTKSKYFSEKVKFNYLDLFLKNTKIKKILMSSDHCSWLKSNEQIDKICRELLSS